ncbi:FAD-dependent oxidoreductase, partial [Vibrio cyclitrophicus]
MNSYDIVVVGGGMVGAATAIGFAKQGLSVAVIEGFAPQAFDESQAMDIRVSAISQASVDLLEALGAWQSIAAMRVCSYKRLETWEHPECRTRFDAASL